MKTTLIRNIEKENIEWQVNRIFGYYRKEIEIEKLAKQIEDEMIEDETLYNIEEAMLYGKRYTDDELLAIINPYTKNIRKSECKAARPYVNDSLFEFLRDMCDKIEFAIAMNDDFDEDEENEAI